MRIGGLFLAPIPHMPDITGSASPASVCLAPPPTNESSSPQEATGMSDDVPFPRMGILEVGLLGPSGRLDEIARAWRFSELQRSE